jgi:hypothetical protein
LIHPFISKGLELSPIERGFASSGATAKEHDVHIIKFGKWN